MRSTTGQLLLDGVALKLGEKVLKLFAYDIGYSMKVKLIPYYLYFMYDENDPHCFLRHQYKAFVDCDGKKEI